MNERGGFANTNSEDRKNQQGDNDFLMSPFKLDSIRNGTKTMEKRAFLDRLNKRLDEIVDKTEPTIFKNIIRKNKGEDIEDKEILKQETDSILAGKSPSDKLSTISEEDLSKILKRLPRQTRQMIYVQRDSLKIKDAILAMDFHANNRVVLFHVDEHDIENELRPGKNEDSVYFSTDIKRLFNLDSAKYIYAVTMDKKASEASKYSGAPDCFRKIKYKGEGDFEIVDKIKIFDEKDPSHRNKTIEDLGANFENYSPANASGANFLKSRVDDDSAFTLRT